MTTRRIATIAAFIGLAVSSLAAQTYNGIALQKVSGNWVQAVPFATVTVCTATATGNPCTPLATIYTDRTLSVPSVNPINADIYGNYTIYAAPGIYLVCVTGTQGLCQYVTVPSITGGTLTSITATSPIVVAPSPIIGVGTVSCPTCGTSSLSGLTNNVVVKGTSTTTIGNSQITDDGTNPVKSPNGYDVGTTGGYDFEIANNAVTGTTATTAVCDDGTGKGIVCPHATSTTNQPLGFVASGAGTTGNATVCNLGWCQVKFDNSTTARHYAIASTTTDGQLHDSGTALTAGQPNYFIVTANGGAGNAGYIRLLTADDFTNATVQVYKVQVNGTTLTAGDTVNLNNTTPVASTNGYNITFQTSKAGTTDSVSGEFVGNGNAAQFLSGTGVLSVPKAYTPYYIPAANCIAGTAGAGWNNATSNFTAACRAGTNNLGGALQAIPNTGASAQFQIELPLDWDTTIQPYIRILYASGANTSGTVIWTVSSACSKEDGSVTDDPTFNAESAFGTQTMAAASRMWGQSGQYTAITSGNNCIAGSTVIMKVALSGTAASNINVYGAVVTIARTNTGQAE